MKTNFLTIAIPNYNRHESLLEQLRRLLPQIVDKDIYLIIIDNYSITPVADFLSEKIILPKNVRIYRNNSNIGIDRNILECLVKTETDWVWTLSDGDFIKENAVEKIYKFIIENYDSVFINLCGHDLESKGFTEFCERFIYWGLFSVSHTIFNVRKLKAYLSTYEKYVSTHNGQLFVLLKYLEDRPNDKCIFNDLDVHQTAPLPTWSKAAFVNDTTHTLNLLNSEFIAYKRIIKKTVNYKIVNQCLGHLCNARAYEGLNLRNYLVLFSKLVPFFYYKNFLGARFFLFIAVIFNPRIYRWARVKSGKKEYELSNASKTLRWDY